MKTKALFQRYPRKIFLLQDLGKGYPGACLLRKSMKTGSELGKPSKIAVLKDLAEDIWGSRFFLWGGRACAGTSKLSKNRRSHRCYQAANIFITMLSVGERSGQAKNGSFPGLERETWGHPAALTSHVFW